MILRRVLTRGTAENCIMLKSILLTRKVFHDLVLAYLSNCKTMTSWKRTYRDQIGVPAASGLIPAGWCWCLGTCHALEWPSHPV